MNKFMKKLQKQVDKFYKENNLQSPIEHNVLDLVSEVGEVSKEVLKMSNYGRNKSLKYRDEISGELGDVLYSLILVANYFDVDLQDSLDNTLKKYSKRLEKGSAGSEVD